MGYLDGITDSMDISWHKLQEIVKDGEPGVLQSKGSQIVRQSLATDQQQDVELSAKLCVKSLRVSSPFPQS